MKLITKTKDDGCWSVKNSMKDLYNSSKHSNMFIIMQFLKNINTWCKVCFVTFMQRNQN